MEPAISAYVGRPMKPKNVMNALGKKQTDKAVFDQPAAKQQKLLRLNFLLNQSLIELRARKRMLLPSTIMRVDIKQNYNKQLNAALEECLGSALQELEGLELRVSETAVVKEIKNSKAAGGKAQDIGNELEKSLSMALAGLKDYKKEITKQEYQEPALKEAGHQKSENTEQLLNQLEQALDHAVGERKGYLSSIEKQDEFSAANVQQSDKASANDEISSQDTSSVRHQDQMPMPNVEQPSKLSGDHEGIHDELFEEKFIEDDSELIIDDEEELLIIPVDDVEKIEEPEDAFVIDDEELSSVSTSDGVEEHIAFEDEIAREPSVSPVSSDEEDEQEEEPEIEIGLDTGEKEEIGEGENAHFQQEATDEYTDRYAIDADEENWDELVTEFEQIAKEEDFFNQPLPIIDTSKDEAVNEEAEDDSQVAMASDKAEKVAVVESEETAEQKEVKGDEVFEELEPMPRAEVVISRTIIINPQEDGESLVEYAEEENDSLNKPAELDSSDPAESGPNEADAQMEIASEKSAPLPDQQTETSVLYEHEKNDELLESFQEIEAVSDDDKNSAMELNRELEKTDPPINKTVANDLLADSEEDDVEVELDAPESDVENLYLSAESIDEAKSLNRDINERAKIENGVAEADRGLSSALILGSSQPDNQSLGRVGLIAAVFSLCLLVGLTIWFIGRSGLSSEPIVPVLIEEPEIMIDGETEFAEGIELESELDMGKLVIESLPGLEEDPGLISEEVVEVDTSDAEDLAVTEDVPSEALVAAIKELETYKKNRHSDYVVEQQNNLNGQDIEEPLVIDNAIYDNDVGFKKDESTSVISGGSWAVNLSSFFRYPPPEDELAVFRRINKNIVVRPVIVRGKRWHRVSVLGFEDRIAATKYARIMRKKTGKQDIWISREKPADNK